MQNSDKKQANTRLAGRDSVKEPYPIKKDRAYYGEYTLKHWIELLLSRNIILPEYQRLFVWKRKDAERLMKSFSEGLFVQPVTIALQKRETSPVNENLIIDGQQRLTAILLSYLGIFPNANKFRAEIAPTDEDEEKGDKPGKQEPEAITWTVRHLVDYCYESYISGGLDGVTSMLRQHIVGDASDNADYVRMPEEMCNSSIYDNAYLGFSYIVPEGNSPEEQEATFTKLFRSINYYGKKLSVVESRRALYYTNSELTNYFEGKCHNNADVLCDIKIVENYKTGKLDFVRYLAILSEYFVLNADKDTITLQKVLKGYSAYSDRETYYADYVSHILNLDVEGDEDKFKDFDLNTRFPGSSWETRFEQLRLNLENLKKWIFPEEEAIFNSWIDADFWLFGLIYHIVFAQKDAIVNIEKLSAEIGEHIAHIKNSPLKSKRGVAGADSNQEKPKKRTKDKFQKFEAFDPASYKKAPNRLNYLRIRLATSIDIYSRYVQ